MNLKNLNTKFLGKNIIYYEEIDSTQEEIWRRIKNKEVKNGMIVIADLQTNGKGTHGRKWYTDQKHNIAFSFFIETNCTTAMLEGITIEITENIISVIEKLYNIKLEIKTPNDIVYKNKKIGGILTQSKSIGDKVKYLVIGIGINTNQNKFNAEIENIASSIKKEFNIEIDRDKVISNFCNLFEEKFLNRIGEN